MSPKRKIPSRKLPSRKFATTKSAQAKRPVSKPLQRPPAPKPFQRPPAATPLPTPQPTIPQCFWDMGFEELPTLEQLRQRYKELSLVLHPDAGGNKQAFVDLRTNYETAQSILNDEAN